MKKVKRVMAVLLSVAMTITLMPSVAFADGENPESTDVAENTQTVSSRIVGLKPVDRNTGTDKVEDSDMPAVTAAVSDETLTVGSDSKKVTKISLTSSSAIPYHQNGNGDKGNWIGFVIEKPDSVETLTIVELANGTTPDALKSDAKF
jgi:hypothetical protein